MDPKQLRHQLKWVVEQLVKRRFVLDVETFQSLEVQRSTLQQKVESLRNQRNTVSKKIGRAKSNGENISLMVSEVVDLGDVLKESETELLECQAALLDFQLRIPNVLDETVPVGDDETNNREIKQWREPTAFTFTPQDHIVLGEALGQIDFNAAAKLSGSRFVVLKGALARLHRALAQFMLDLHIQQHGYQEVYVPYLVHSEMLYGTGQLPKLQKDVFQIAGECNLTLIPTGEVPLANLVRDTIVDQARLPLKWVAHTPCFRSEAGSYGKDVRGMIRQHQFEKVEMVQLVQPETSYAALEVMLSHAEKVLQLLELPYRVLLLCSGDTGFSAAKTYDLEVWMPGQQQYREISSCSNCEDFQARRMKARYRTEHGKIGLLHSLNGSGLAIGRTLIAVMENYQDAQGRIRVPTVLQPYLGGVEWIS